MSTPAFNGYVTPERREPERRTRPTYADWFSDKRRGTILVAPRSPEPRPRATPVPETDRTWRPKDWVF